jgi:cell division protein FtsN
MSVQNTRRLMTETYDPKQRIVGGIVLILIVLFIYSILKLVLGISSAGGGKFEIGEELREEPREVTETASTNSPGEANHSGSGRPINPVIRLPKAFVFLNINGDPLQKEFLWQTITSNGKEISAKSTEDKNWYVQAASFRDEERANQLAQKIKDKNIASEVVVVKSGNGWYTVRLPPQADRDSAEKQRKQLNSQLRLKSEVKKVD